MAFSKPPLGEQKAILDALSPSGYVIAFNYSWAGPELFDCTYPEDWQQHYHSRSMWKADPITLWIMANDGQKRWSEIKLTKMNSLMSEAADYGLTYGVVLARSKRMRKSVLSVARPDREYTDNEIQTLAEFFDEATRRIDDKFDLSDKEVETLAQLGAGQKISDIARIEGRSEAAINKRVKSARLKLNQPNTLAAVVFAKDQKLI